MSIKLPLVNLYASELICGCGIKKSLVERMGLYSSCLICGWAYLPSFTVLDILKEDLFRLKVLHFYEKARRQLKQIIN